MSKSIFNPEDWQVLDARLARLRPDSRARFGKFTAPRMVCHLTDALEIATGVVPARTRKTIMSNRLVRWLIIYVIPWPKGKAQTTSEFLKTQPASWDADLTRLRAMLKSVAERGADQNWAPHPAFGDLSGKDYGALIHRHFHHHLDQFGA